MFWFSSFSYFSVSKEENVYSIANHPTIGNYMAIGSGKQWSSPIYRSKMDLRMKVSGDPHWWRLNRHPPILSLKISLSSCSVLFFQEFFLLSSTSGKGPYIEECFSRKEIIYFFFYVNHPTYFLTLKHFWHL